MQVHLRYYEDEVKKGRWNRLVEQLADKFKDLLSDWTLEICCFGSELVLSDFLTKYNICKVFRAWYPASMLDSEQEMKIYASIPPYNEEWHKMPQKDKISKFMIDLMGIFGREGSRREYKYFENKETIEILKNLSKRSREVKKVYKGHYEGWLFLKDPLLKEYEKGG